MKWNVTVIALFVWVASSAQIEIIQYSAESGISLKLPENAIELIEDQIEEIIESKF